MGTRVETDMKMIRESPIQDFLLEVAYYEGWMGWLKCQNSFGLKVCLAICISTS